jgi:mannose-6-phosphate isomerase-like protein (cupin superfamily)
MGIARKAKIIPPEDGRIYAMGRMRAIFKADLNETANNYSLSEWWLEPRTRGPGEHSHEEDHVYFVIEGTLSVLIDGNWASAAKGSDILIPGGTPHNFENQGTVRSGFISLNVPGGFEARMPDIAKALGSEDLRM